MKLPRNAQIWLPGYIRSRMSGSPPPARVWLAIADHHEPLRRGADEETGRRRVGAWRRRWPEIAARHRDSLGRPPVYTFFYPQEEYRPSLVDPLVEMTALGIADVEVHIHHDGEGERDFLDRMSGFIETLFHRHGLLRKQGDRIVFGFIHGNWALDNSHPGGRWCGLNNEITLLRDLGCYADFTMPSAPSPTQARLVNRIYWTIDDPQKPKSYDTGIPLLPGGPTGDLLMIPGPFGLRWATRLWPRLETGELAGNDLATSYRARRWLDLAPRIGRDVFLKLHGHGALERNAAPLLGGGLDELFTVLSDECRRRGCPVHYVSAWQMRQAIEALRLHEDPLEAVLSAAPAGSKVRSREEPPSFAR